jgi:hypothetical protein
VAWVQAAAGNVLTRGAGGGAGGGAVRAEAVWLQAHLLTPGPATLAALNADVARTVGLTSHGGAEGGANLMNSYY